MSFPRFQRRAMFVSSACVYQMFVVFHDDCYVACIVLFSHVACTHDGTARTHALLLRLRDRERDIKGLVLQRGIAALTIDTA